jgi:hypothetical protein
MNRLQPPNPADSAVTFFVTAAFYFAKPLTSTSVPLWAVAATLLVVMGALWLIRATMRGRAERERREEARHKEVIARLERLAEAKSFERAKSHTGRRGDFSRGRDS